jgi:hypothetical protein
VVKPTARTILFDFYNCRIILLGRYISYPLSVIQIAKGIGFKRSLNHCRNHFSEAG